MQLASDGRAGKVELLTGIRGEFDDNMLGAAKIISEDLKLWGEFEPKARLLVRDLRNHADAPFRFLWAMRMYPD
jgi:hypothetical protein